MDLEKISKCGKICNFSKYEIICLEGQPGETAYLLLKGHVNVMVGSFKDSSKIVATIRAGSLFGEMSLLENAPRSATVAAGADDTVALEIGKDDFIRLMKTEPELAYNLLRTLAGRIEDIMNKHQGYLVAYNAEVRRNVMYNQVKNLSKEQFTEIVEKDEEYALKLLKYLSHTLTLFDVKVVEISNKKPL